MSMFKVLPLRFFLLHLVVVCCQFATPAFLCGQTEAIENLEFDQRRAEVMAFVHENHAEMERLLLVLETGKPKKFQAAIKRISKAIQRMDGVKGRNPERYKIVVERWRIKSDIEILTARIAYGDSRDAAANEAFRKQLVTQVDLFIENRKKLLKMEKDNLQRRLEKTNRLIDEVENERDEFLKKSLRSVEKTLKQLKMQNGEGTTR